jgi:hypothetical protein
MIQKFNCLIDFFSDYFFQRGIATETDRNLWDSPKFFGTLGVLVNN